MPTPTPDQQILQPIGADSADNPTAFANQTGVYEDRLSKLYTGATDRTTRNGAPGAGELSTFATGGVHGGIFYGYSGAAWIQVASQVLIGLTAADVSLTLSSTTFQDVAGLSVSVVASATYVFQSGMIYDSSTTADIKFQAVIPSGTFSMYGAGVAVGTAGTSFDTNAAKVAASAALSYGGAGVGTLLGATPTGILRTGVTAGTFKIQAAQNTVDATQSTIRQDSWFLLIRIA